MNHEDVPTPDLRSKPIAPLGGEPLNTTVEQNLVESQENFATLQNVGSAQQILNQLGQKKQ